MLGFSSDWAVASSHPKTCETNPRSHIITKSQLFWVSTVISNRWPSDTIVVSVLHVSVSSQYCQSNVSASSRSRDSNVSVSSRSLHLTSRLHRTSKVKLRTITTKFSILPLQRYLGCLVPKYLCREYTFLSVSELHRVSKKGSHQTFANNFLKIFSLLDRGWIFPTKLRNIFHHTLIMLLHYLGKVNR